QALSLNGFRSSYLTNLYLARRGLPRCQYRLVRYDDRNPFRLRACAPRFKLVGGLMESTILTIANHEGVVQWVQQALEDIGHTEVVSRSDLGRVVRSLEATNANVVLVEADQNDIGH